jgi:hypothetical protein
MNTALGVAIGIGLAAAAGFRVFVPFLVVSIAALSGHLHLSPSFAWAGTWPALVAFATATVIEVAAYYVPWLDHLLDVVATPLAVVAGVVVSAAVIVDLPPLFKWGLALIAGGGVAGVVQGATVLARLKSSLATGGLANPLVATAELFSSLSAAILSLVLPVLVLLLVGAGCAVIFIASGRFLFGRPRHAAREQSPPSLPR